MELKETINKIVNDINNIVKDDFRPALYIGKTDNICRRMAEHETEGYPYTLHLANGPAEKISVMEEELIAQLKEKHQLINKITASPGNNEASCLYICMTDCYPNDDLGEYDEKVLLGQEYPLSIS